MTDPEFDVETEQTVTVAVSRTVRIADRRNGKVIFELTNRDGQVAFKRVANSGTVKLEDLAEAVEQLK